MLNIPEYKEYGGETKIALMDNSSLAFMHELSQRSYPSDGILSVYDLILIPKWVMEEIEDSTYRSTYVEQLQAKGYPIRWIDETKYGTFVNFEDVNLYYIVEAAVSRVSELMRFLRRKVKTEDLIDLPSAEEWMNRLYDEWPIHGRTLSTGRTLKKNAGEISLTILAEIFAWYHDGVDSLTIYTQDTDAHKFQTNAERILTENSEFTPALDSPISVAFKSNDFILCQMYREGALTLDAVRQLRRDDRKLTYTRQQADMQKTEQKTEQQAGLGMSFCEEEGRITVFRKTLEALEWPSHYRFLYNRKMKQIAVQACGAEESGAHRVGKPDESNSGEIKCMALVRMIYGDSGWDKKMSYRLIGRAFPQQRLVSFKITDAMQIENGRVLTEM